MYSMGWEIRKSKGNPKSKGKTKAGTHGLQYLSFFSLAFSIHLWISLNRKAILKICKNSEQKFDSLTHVTPLTTRDEPWPLFHFWRHQLWTKLVLSILSTARGKDLSNDTQVRVIASMDLICRNLSQKLRAKFPATTHGYSMAKIVGSMILSSPAEGKSLQQKYKKRRLRKGQKNKKRKA